MTQLTWDKFVTLVNAKFSNEGKNGEILIGWIDMNGYDSILIECEEELKVS